MTSRPALRWRARRSGRSRSLLPRRAKTSVCAVGVPACCWVPVAFRSQARQKERKRAREGETEGAQACARGRDRRSASVRERERQKERKLEVETCGKQPPEWSNERAERDWVDPYAPCCLACLEHLSVRYGSALWLVTPAGGAD
eukprot:SAG11_NODE_1034_length_6091_cov_6.237984_3_plen_144_part_00